MKISTSSVVYTCSIIAALVSVVSSFSLPKTFETTKQASSWFETHHKICKKSSTSGNKNEYDKAKDPFVITYLEINGFLMTLSGVTILIDPILEGPLDFGIPSFYEGNKRKIPSSGLIEHLPPTIDCLLITQGLDDHAHLKTLSKISKSKNCRISTIVAPRSASSTLQRAGFVLEDDKDKMNNNQPSIRLVKTGDAVTLEPNRSAGGNGAAGVEIRATRGALVGPPWQARENGYILRALSASLSSDDVSKDNCSSFLPTSPSIYLEPHVEFDKRELQREAPIDILITPTSGQSLPGSFELVHGPKDSLELVNILQPEILIPMPNGNVDAQGMVSKIVTEIGSAQEFEQKLKERHPNVKLLNLEPGKDTEIIDF